MIDYGVRRGDTAYTELKHALASLEFANAKLLGKILNGVKSGGRYGNHGQQQEPKSSL